MACGTITICGSIAATNNFIINGVNGYLVDKDDSHEIANMIKYIVDNQMEQNQIKENARKFVELNADIRREITLYKKCFHSVISH